MSSSVFAALLGDLEARSPASPSALPRIADLGEEATAPELCAQPAASPSPGQAAVPQATEPPPSRPDEAVTIAALGPAMLARLRRIGYRRFADLATATPDTLRAALGDRGTLLNVAGWIEAAGRVAAHEAQNPFADENEPPPNLAQGSDGPAPSHGHVG